MFSNLSPLPADPLLGLIAKIQQDTNPEKIDLGVGVYRDATGNTPILESVKKAEATLLSSELSKSYVGPFGNQRFNEAIGELVLGKENLLLDSKRVAVLQTPGGCGALRVAAELIIRAKPNATIWVSNPTWANHVPLLGDAGLMIKTYPYYDFDKKNIDYAALTNCLENEASKGDIVLLHGCCHNPSGADLQNEQWDQLADLLHEKQLLPLVDIAYQGLGTGLDEDSYGIRSITSKVPETLFAFSCSKNFGLYRERVGAVGYIANNTQQAEIGMTHMANITRGIYSMPPSHGASIVELILSSEELLSLWHTELNSMRNRIQQMRKELVQNLDNLGLKGHFSFIENEKGMFSFLGITPQQVEHLADKYSIYMAGTSRMNIAGLNPSNIHYFCQSIASVLAPK